MQQQNRSSSHFSQRTEILSEQLGLLLRDLPVRIGISDRMFYGYRSGSYPISDKAWRKLEAAERAAGLGIPESAPPPALGEPSAEPPPDHGDGAAEMARRIADLLRPDLPGLFPMAELIGRMEAAGAWPPTGADLTLTPGQLWAKYTPR